MPEIRMIADRPHPFRWRCALLLALACTLLSATGAAAQGSGIPAGFTPLFNGRDLTGWHLSRTTHQGTTPDAHVENGVLVLQQRPYGQGGVLLTNRKYSSFELSLEVKTDWATNGGIFLRSTESGAAYQIELVGDGAPTTGNLLPERISISKGAVATQLASVWKQGDWNSLRVRMTGEVPSLSLWVNGVHMWDVTEPQNDFVAGATEGYIGLQTHWTTPYAPVPDAFCCPANWKPGASHRFRNISIKELP
jgi:hypothetical protein